MSGEKTIDEKVLSMRFNEFGFAKICFIGRHEDVFPERFHVVKWVQSTPFVAYSVREGKSVEVTSYNYAIGELEWNDHEPCWEFRSVGTRFLKDGNEELMKWILDFCERYEVADGKLKEIDKEKNRED